jgi:hypothetical protein
MECGENTELPNPDPAAFRGNPGRPSEESGLAGPKSRVDMSIAAKNHDRSITETWDITFHVIPPLYIRVKSSIYRNDPSFLHFAGPPKKQSCPSVLVSTDVTLQTINFL